jgi:hypothetical protein
MQSYLKDELPRVANAQPRLRKVFELGNISTIKYWTIKSPWVRLLALL